MCRFALSTRLTNLYLVPLPTGPARLPQKRAHVKPTARPWHAHLMTGAENNKKMRWMTRACHQQILTPPLSIGFPHSSCPVWMKDRRREKLRRDQTTRGWRGSAGPHASSLIPILYLSEGSLISTCSTTMTGSVLDPPNTSGDVKCVRYLNTAIKTYWKEQSFPTVKCVSIGMHVIWSLQIIVKHGRAPMQTSKHPDVDFNLKPFWFFRQQC